MKQQKELASIIREHYTSLCAVALKFVKSTDVAQDIAQEAIISYWETQKKQLIEAPEKYLYVLVRNASINYLRSIRREFERYNKLFREESGDPQLLGLLIEEEANQLLLEAIRELPEHCSRVIRLGMSGFNEKEMARVMNTTLSLIKSYKYEAMRRLREFFAEKYGE